VTAWNILVNQKKETGSTVAMEKNGVNGPENHNAEIAKEITNGEKNMKKGTVATNGNSGSDSSATEPGYTVSETTRAETTAETTADPTGTETASGLETGN
jgi:hypothetical protein